MSSNGQVMATDPASGRKPKRGRTTARAIHWAETAVCVGTLTLSDDDSEIRLVPVAMGGVGGKMRNAPRAWRIMLLHGSRLSVDEVMRAATVTPATADEIERRTPGL